MWSAVGNQSEFEGRRLGKPVTEAIQKEERMKLFKVTIGNGKYSYVVAEHSKEAGDILLAYLKKKDMYFISDRYVSEVLFIGCGWRINNQHSELRTCPRSVF